MKSSRRPRIVTWLALGVLIVSAGYLTRFVVGLRLPELPLTVPAWYVPVNGAVWGLSGLAVAYGLFRGRTWAPALLRLGGLAFLLWYWADRLLLVRTDYAVRTRPFSVFVTFLAVVAIAWVLRQSSVQAYFRENTP